MEAFLRRMNALNLNDEPRICVDIETNVVLSVLADGKSIEVTRFCCRGDEIVEDVDSSKISLLTLHFPSAATNPDDHFDVQEAWNLLASFTSIRTLVFLNVDARSAPFQQLLATMVANNFNVCTPKNVKIVESADHENLLLNLMWEILSRGLTKNVEIVNSALGSKLKEVIAGWVQATAHWERFRIAQPQSLEECNAMATLAEEIFADWRSAMEIRGSWQMFEIESAHLKTFMEPGAFFEDHQFIREASAQISILRDENLFTAFFHKSDSSYLS